MKRYYAILAIFTLFSSVTYSQAWQKNSKVLSLGLGGSSFFHINPNNNGYLNFYSPFTGQINVQGEFGVCDYVGVGFTTGIGGGGPTGLGSFWGRGSWYNNYYRSSYNGSFNFPIGVIANFHFYQLIEDKTDKNIHADKLDIYAGLNLGSGVGILFFDNYTQVGPLAFGGFQAGARYYFTEKFGANLELGYGKSIINGGLVWKL